MLGTEAGVAIADAKDRHAARGTVDDAQVSASVALTGQARPAGSARGSDGGPPGTGSDHGPSVRDNEINGR